MGAAPDSPPQLVELGQAESLRPLYQHHRRIRDVDADFDHRCGDQDIDLSRSKKVHHLLLLGERQPAMQEPQPERREGAGRQVVELFDRRPGTDLFRLIYKGADDKSLASGGDLIDHQPVRVRTLVRGPRP